MTIAMITPALLGGAQMLLGVDAYTRLQGIMKPEQFFSPENHEFNYPAMGKLGYYLKAASHFSTAITLLALGTLYPLIAYNAFGLALLPIFQGAVTWIPQVSLGFAGINILLQLIGATLVRSSLASPTQFHRHYHCGGGLERALRPRNVFGQASGSAHVSLVSASAAQEDDESFF